MKIEVLGPGCPKCNMTYDNVNKALKELNKEAEVIKITDINVMIDKGMLQSPGLTIDGKLVIQGKIPTVEQIKIFINKGV